MPKIIELLEQYGIPYKKHGEHHHAREGWLQLDCPWCGKDSYKFHLGLNLTYHYLNCWRCGPHKMMPTLAELLDIPASQIAAEVGSLETAKHKPIEHKGRYSPPRNLLSLTNCHKHYLKSRGFNPTKLQNLWRIQSIGLDARLSHRIFIPMTMRGEQVSWTTRAASDKSSRRYLNAKPDQESVPRNQILYGWDYVRHTACVVEGPTDVWKIGPGAVATMGLQFSHCQVQLLARLPKVVICFDNQPVAQKRAKALRDQLLGKVVLVQLDSDDPGSATEDEIAEIRRLLLKNLP